MKRLPSKLPDEILLAGAALQAAWIQTDLQHPARVVGVCRPRAAKQIRALPLAGRGARGSEIAQLRSISSDRASRRSEPCDRREGHRHHPAFGLRRTRTHPGSRKSGMLRLSTGLPVYFVQVRAAVIAVGQILSLQRRLAAALRRVAGIDRRPCRACHSGRSRWCCVDRPQCCR